MLKRMSGIRKVCALILFASMCVGDCQARGQEVTTSLPLYSNFQVFGLIIGQGNYADPAGGGAGRLAGAEASARLVAENLGRVNKAGRDRNIVVVAGGDEGQMTKAEITARIDKFVEMAKKKADPGKQSVIFFYFFGHGLSDGFARFAFLVPEASEGDASPPRNATEMADRLIEVGWVRERLAEVSDNVIIMIDSCRTNERDSEKFLTYWEKIFKQDTQWASGIFQVLRKINGSTEKSPLLFSSEDGTPTRPVSYKVAETLEDIGPISVRLDFLFRQVTEQREALTVADFVGRMQTPVETEGGVKVRAFTDLKSLSGLNSLTLISSPPKTLTPRMEPYPGAGSSGAAVSLPSSADMKRRLNAEPFAGLIDFVYRAEQNSFFLIDGDWKLWQWNRNQSKRLLIKEELPLPSIGATSDWNIYLHQADNNRLLMIRGSSQFVVIAEEIFLGFFGEGYQNRSLLAIEKDATVGTKDKVYRLNGKSLKLITALDTTNISDMVEWRPNQFYYAIPNDGTIYKLEEGRNIPFRSELSKPALLAATDEYLYCIDQSGQLLYRLDAQGNLSETLLSKPEGGKSEVLLRNLDARGFRVVSPNILYWVEGSFLLELNLTQARWKRR